MKSIYIYLVIISIIFAIILQYTKAQEKNQAIPELTEMHQYIHPMWHKGYAEKDYQLLKALYADLINQFEKLKNAPFPVKWPDKQRHAVKQLSKLKNFDYTEKLIQTIEILHEAYVQLNKFLE